MLRCYRIYCTRSDVQINYSDLIVGAYHFVPVMRSQIGSLSIILGSLSKRHTTEIGVSVLEPV